MADLHYQSIAQLAARLKAGTLSPVELTQATLDRIDALNPSLHAYITPMHEAALAAARAAEAAIRAGDYLGPLHGIPIALKDLVYTAGVATTGGSAIMREFTPDYDATVVRKLQAAGAIIVGKLNMHEFAYGPTGINGHYGTPTNPWNAERIPGGSSSGSGVAVATGLCAGALGSDTGGSIRIPAACCGIVGLKPTYGRVSRYGVLALAWSLDHVGPMTRTVEDAAIMLNALAGVDAKDPGSALEDAPDFTAGLQDGVRGLRIGVPRDDFFANVDPAVIERVEAAVGALSGLGAQVREVSLPLVREASAISGLVLSAEAATYHLPLLRQHWDAYGHDVRTRLLPGFTISADSYLNAQRARQLFINKMRAAFDEVDLLLYPSEPVVAPKVEDRTVTVGALTEPTTAAMTRLNRPGNVSGFPAISVPCGFVNGLPVGLQLMGRPWEEATVLQAAQAYEQATEWHAQRPAVS